LPTAQRSLIRHPRAIFLAPSSLQILKSIFSHLPDGAFTPPLNSPFCPDFSDGAKLGDIEKINGFKRLDP
jgi:hypothetical protein